MLIYITFNGGIKNKFIQREKKSHKTSLLDHLEKKTKQNSLTYIHYWVKRNGFHELSDYCYLNV